MRILIASIGKVSAGPEQALFDTYRARSAWPVEKIEMNAKARDPQKRREEESALLLRKTSQASKRIALDETGRSYSSQNFADLLSRWQGEGCGSVAFLIGGADGHSDIVRRESHLLMALGPMTWPHRLVPALLMEQIYRAQSILSGHPYHRANSPVDC